ncbi:MAG: MBL fold metallo-hydrolase [Candidatus Aminicenantes bacterium]
MKELCFLGTGGSLPWKDRSNASLVLNIENDLLLIDCPGDAFGKIKKLDLDPRNIYSIFVTHTHPDHIYGLPALIHSLMLVEMSILLYGSGETIKFCKQLLDLFNLLDKKIKCRVRFKKVYPDQFFEIHRFLRACSIKTPHTSSSLGICFDFGDEQLRLIYSGDTPVYLPLFKNSGSPDILIHDCSAPSRYFKKYPSLSKMHTSSLDLGKIAQQAGVRFLIPIHFFGELDYSLDEIEKEIRKNYKNRLMIPKDLDKIEISKSLLSIDVEA